MSFIKSGVFYVQISRAAEEVTADYDYDYDYEYDYERLLTARRLVFLGAFFGLVAVAAGAFGAHALKARLAPERLVQFELAVRYQMYHALALFAVAFVADRFPSKAARSAGYAFLVGILIFCGTVYGLAFGGPRWLGAITPIGGLSLMVGWTLLAAATLIQRETQ